MHIPTIGHTKRNYNGVMLRDELPPSLFSSAHSFCVAALAAEHRAATMYVDGQADVWSRTDTSLFQMGEGTVFTVTRSTTLS